MWCFPQQGSYKMKLREVLKEYGRFKKQAKQLQEYILKEFTFENQSKKFIEAAIPIEEYDMEFKFQKDRRDESI